MFFPLAMLYGIYFTFLPRQLLGYELEEKHYNIFPPGPVFFLLVTEKLVKKLMGERKMVFFPISIYFPHGPCCTWFPFSDSYSTEVHENDDIYPWLKGIDRSFELRGKIRLNRFVRTNWRVGIFLYFILKGHHHKISKKPIEAA
jgi:hypothetical protein